MFEHVRKYLHTSNTAAYEREIKKQREERRKAITQIKQSITANENEQARFTLSLGKVKEVTQDPARQEHLQMLILDQVNVLEDARQGLLVELAKQQQAQEDDIGSLDKELADLEELWNKFHFRKRQSYINFLVKDVVIDVVSTHWISIQISWLHDVSGVEEMYHYRERGSHNKWSEEEDALTCQYYPTMPKLELMELLPLRVWDAIIKRARMLDISRPMTLARTTRSKVGYHPHLSHADITLMQELNIPIHRRGEELIRPNTEWVKPLEPQRRCKQHKGRHLIKTRRWLYRSGVHRDPFSKIVEIRFSPARSDKANDGDNDEKENKDGKRYPVDVTHGVTLPLLNQRPLFNYTENTTQK